MEKLLFEYLLETFKKLVLILAISVLLTITSKKADIILK